MTALDPQHSSSRQKIALLGALFIFLSELFVIGTLFKHAIDFKCLDNWPIYACQGASGTMIAIYCCLGALLLLFMLRPAPFQRLINQAGQHIWPLGLNLLGAAVALIPLSLLGKNSGTSALIPSFICWGLGMALILIGLALFIAPIGRWSAFLKEEWSSLLPVLVVGSATPYLATIVRPLWHIETIADYTFNAVAWLIQFAGYEIDIYTAEKVIGKGDFHIGVAPQCSGVEGLALVTIFVTLYLFLFRRTLKFPGVLLLFPLGMTASIIFNVIRVAVLLIIGLEGNPELAVGGFHSHAGWLMFTLVALGIVALAQSVPALQKNAAHTKAAPAPLVPFFQDQTVAFILPFAVFMFSALLATALTSSPALFYPARVVLMVLVLAAFLPIFKRLPWRLDPVAISAGALIGLAWVIIPVDPVEGPAPYGTLTGAALVGWFVLRGFGTMILVPIIEEVFFRGYLEPKMRLGTGRAWILVASLGTAVLFAALHGRWAEAFAASLIFSWVAYRKGNITDAIVSHMAANAIVFGVAVATGNLAII
ncbi:exosortase E/protease, VPEID-CTERM system [Algirhabdus cladophorae]|uniref:exosortase E/protease, VPEID-CTERM system n=1 Tax=Algirhabdus cladophorae TaxID=3377108 RepID=UPI003B8484EE